MIHVNSTGGCPRKRPWLGLTLCCAILKFWTIFERGAPCPLCSFCIRHCKSQSQPGLLLSSRTQDAGHLFCEDTSSPCLMHSHASPHFQLTPPFSRPPYLRKPGRNTASAASPGHRPTPAQRSTPLMRELRSRQRSKQAPLLSPVHWRLTGSAATAEGRHTNSEALTSSTTGHCAQDQKCSGCLEGP